jgi:hypothetical protein
MDEDTFTRGCSVAVALVVVAFFVPRPIGNLLVIGAVIAALFFLYGVVYTIIDEVRPRPKEPSGAKQTSEISPDAYCAAFHAGNGTDLQLDERWRTYAARWITWRGKLKSCYEEAGGGFSVLVEVTTPDRANHLFLELSLPENERSRLLRISKGAPVWVEGSLPLRRPYSISIEISPARIEKIED